MPHLPHQLTEEIRCSVCGNVAPQEFSLMHEFDDFAVVQCDRCSFQFIPHFYRKHIVYTQYKNADVTAAIRAGNNWIKIQRHKLRFRFIGKFAKSGELFDLGAGWGHFMLAAKELGYNASGIEISEQQALYCINDLKLNVVHGDFFKIDESKKFDIITMWDVLEHIDRPDDILKKCGRITKQGGLLFVLIPQVDSIIARLTKKNWKMMGLDHVNYFSKRTVTTIMENSGYEVLKIKSSFEIKLFIMYTLLPWLKRFRSRKKQSLRDVNATITGAERQQYFNKFTARPAWQLKLFIALYNTLYNLLSALRIGDEMIVAARKK